MWAAGLAAVALAALFAGCPKDEDPVEPIAGAPARPKPKPRVEPDLPPIDPLAPVDRATLRTPWARVAIGDWAEYRTPEGTVRVEVVALAPNSVTVRRGERLQEILLGPEERDYIRSKDPGVLSPDRFERDTEPLEVAGQELYCLVVRPRGRGGEETWYSEDVAIDDGVVLKRERGEVVLELIGWGSGAGAGGPREQ